MAQYGEVNKQTMLSQIGEFFTWDDSDTQEKAEEQDEVKQGSGSTPETEPVTEPVEEPDEPETESDDTEMTVEMDDEEMESVVLMDEEDDDDFGTFADLDESEL
jgi:hypothetical protein